MRIEGKGFLGLVLPALSETVRGANEAHDNHALLRKMIDFAETLKDELLPSSQQTPEQRQRMIAFIVFIRLLEIVEALVILAAYGIKEELKSLFRIFLDAYFILANCCNDPSFIPVYFRTDEAARLKLAYVAEKYQQSELFKLVNEYATKEMKNELDAEIKREKNEAFNSYQFAQNVGCEAIYDSMYRIASAAVHTTPRCLEDYVDADAEGNITVVNHGPDGDITDGVMRDTCLFFLKCLRGLCELFAVDKESNLKEFEQKLGAKENK